MLLSTQERLLPLVVGNGLFTKLKRNSILLKKKKKNTTPQKLYEIAKYLVYLH